LIVVTNQQTQYKPDGGKKMVDAKNALDEILDKIFGSHAEALAYSENPTEYLVAEGLGEADMSSLNITQSVEGACSTAGLAPEMAQQVTQVARSGGYSRSASSSSSSASAAATPPPPTLETVQQVISQTVTVVYEGDEVIIQNIDNSTNIDNSVTTDIDVAGDLDGEIFVENEVTNVNATGDNAVAVGEDNEGQINTGDGAVQAGGNVTDTVVGDGNTVIDVEGDAVIGDNNQTVQGSEEANVAFGEGDVNDFEGAEFENSNVNIGDNNTIDDGDVDIADSFNDESIDIDVDLGRGSGGGQPSADPGGSAVPDPTSDFDEAAYEEAKYEEAREYQEKLAEEADSGPVEIVEE
jgi:hypothetical protein